MATLRFIDVVTLLICVEDLIFLIPEKPRPASKLQNLYFSLIYYFYRLYKTSATYWEGKADQESLQRVYGITFPDKKQLTEWVNFQEEAKKRDHRRIGTQQELWTFDPVSAGSCFWLPRGAVIYNRLQVGEMIFGGPHDLSRTLFEVNTESKDSRKLSRQTSSTLNIRPLATLRRRYVHFQGRR